MVLKCGEANMKAKILKIIMGGIIITGGIFFIAAKIKAENLLPAPIIVSPNEQTIVGHPKPKIIGLAKSGTEALVYIDGIYNGKTEFLEHPSGAANFAYTPFLNLPVGRHQAEVFIRDKNGNRSKSSFFEFCVESFYPAPTLFQTVLNASTTPDKPFIVGLAKNNSKIQVFIDKVFFGEFKVKNHPSGAANFAYQPFAPLTNGRHSVYTRAIDERGKKSPKSELIYFKVRAPRISAIRVENKEMAKISGQGQERELIKKAPEDENAPINFSNDFTAVWATSTGVVGSKRIIFAIVATLVVLGMVYLRRRTSDTDN